MKNVSFKWAILLFFVGATRQFDLPIAARIPLSEVLAFCSIPILFRRINLQPYMPKVYALFGLLLVWFLGCLVSDFANQNLLLRGVRGAVKPIFCFLWALFFLGILVRDYRLLVYLFYGAFFASLQNYLMPTATTEEHMLAGGYQEVAYLLAPIIKTFFVALAIWFYRFHHLYAVVALAGMASVLGVVGAPRSMSAISLMAAFLVAYVWWANVINRGRFRLSVWKLFGLGVSSLIVLIGIYYLYIYAASQGLLGEFQMQKLESQSKTIYGHSPIGLVLSGRPQVFGAVLAIMDSPLLGYGSWTAWLMSDYLYEAMNMVGTDPLLLQRIANGAKAGIGHSIILQLWLENGILVMIVLMIILFRFFKVLVATLQKDNPLAPLIIYTFVSFFWAFWFSPFGTGSREAIGMFMALHICGFPQHRQCFVGRGYGRLSPDFEATRH